MPVDPKRVQTVFLAAVEQVDPASRVVVLNRECGSDAELRQRVEALLRANDASGSFLDRPAVAPAQSLSEVPPNGPADSTPPHDARPAGQVGTLVAGRYKLLQQIGEGGMGSVFMAEQTQPFKRMVAFKAIKTGMDSKQVLARFESERQALALMDHPNIAKVLDAGTTERGQPFFVMELVKGMPLTQFCDERHLSVGDRLKVFQQVCHAVQHAHQKGIIHRDLKPSNILVELHNGRPVPKIIDFGLAKAINAPPLTERSLFTHFGAVLGTPLYMAPEQAELTSIDVDTRADIYAMGVILYELLTGTTPFEKNRFVEAAWEEIRRVIKDEEPQTPSARLSTSEARVSIAEQRQSEPHKLGKFVRGDLDWIVMKALAKERDRRYETADAFAADVERFLNDDPVSAGPPTAGYKLRKFLRRHRAVVLTAVVVAAALIAGTSVAIWQAVVATRAKQDALAATAAEKVAKDAAKAAKEKAEQAEANTLADYRASTDDAIEQLIGSKRELGSKEKTYLESTLKRWQAFADRQGDDERSQAIRGEGHFRVASLWSHLGRKEEARAEYETARALQKKLAEQFPAVADYQQQLARTHDNLGIVRAELGKREEALVEHQAARDLKKKLAEQFPDVPTYQKGLALTHNNLGVLLADLGRREEARTEYQAARELRKMLAKQFPAEPEYQHELASTHMNLGIVRDELGERDEARVDYLVARDIQKKLVKQCPAVPEYQQLLAQIHHNLGMLLAELGKSEEARLEYEAACDIYRRLVEQFPALPINQHYLALTGNNLGILLESLGKREAARAEYQAARDILKKLVEQFPGVPGYQIGLGSTYCNYGVLTRNEGKLAESLEWYDLAIQTLKVVHDKEPRDVTAQQFLWNSHWNRARACERLQKFAAAVKDWDRIIELSSPAQRPGLRVLRATCQIRAGLIADAVAEIAELTAPNANATWLANWNASQWYDFACIYAVASGKVVDQKQEYASRAVELLQKAVRAGYKDAAHMQRDTDLDPLRNRKDFKELLAELDAAKTKKQN